MSLTAYLRKRLVDLLDERRLLVWYDGEQAFGQVPRTFAGPNTTVVLVGDSRLRARRQADEVFCGLNDASQPSQVKNGSLLIYCPWSRGRTDEERCQDPFEGFGRVGAAFGDKEAETFQSLARQAMPDRSAEIDRLFADGRPTLALIEGLGENVRYPLLQEALGSDTLTEVVAQLLCRNDAARKLNAVVGADTELLRLLQAVLGFAPPPRVTVLESIREHLGRYVLFSEFVLDLPGTLPEQLAAVPRAAGRHRQAVYSLCERMRGSDDTRDGYIALAADVEKALRLPELTRDLLEPGIRATFPYQENAGLKRLEALAKAGNFTEARKLVEQHQRSVWRYVPERALLWKLADRCVDFLDAVEVWSNQVFKTGDTVRSLVQAYTAAEGFWHTDRQQRLVEQGAAACADDEEVASLVEICRERYTEVVGAAQAIFVRAVEREGWPPEGILRQTQVFNKYVAPPLEERRKVAYFLVDSMRYEMGRDLGSTLDSFGSVTIASAAAVLPTVTPCGMAALMAGADGVFTLVDDKNELAPAIAGRVLRNSADRMELLRECYGDRFCDVPLGELLSMSQKKIQAKFGKTDLLVVRSQEIDAEGEGLDFYLARKLMSDVIGEVRTVTDKLIEIGFQTCIYAADHGHVLLPEVAPGNVIQPPAGEWKMAKRRCRLGKSLSRAPGVMVLRASHVGITGPVEEYVVPIGLNPFVAGQGYFHEGLSLQECLIPVVVLQARGQQPVGPGAEEVEIRYRSDRFTSRVVGVKVWFNALLGDSLTVRVDAYDGSGQKAKVVGEAADCEARDPATHWVTLAKGKETQVPVRIRDDFDGASVEIRATDPVTSRIFHRLKLKNSLME